MEIYFWFKYSYLIICFPTEKIIEPHKTFLFLERHFLFLTLRRKWAFRDTQWILFLWELHNTIVFYIKFILSGHVYGERALEAQALQNEGQVICPRTKEIYSFKDAEKVYIM